MALRKPLVLDSVGQPSDLANGDACLDKSPVTVLGVTGTVNIDCSLGNYFTLDAPTGNVTLTASNVPVSPLGYTMMLRFKQHGTTSRTVTFFSAKWPGGTLFVVSATANAIDVIAFTTFDNGTTWFANGNAAYA